MVTLRQDDRGNFIARKRPPKDVQEEYGRRFGQRLETKFFAASDTGLADAKRQFRDWENEVDGGIAGIRAERTGELALTREQACAHAGEWYEWFVARHPASEEGKWQALRDQVHDALREAVGDDEESRAPRSR
jgi:hypothetical protein